MSFSFGLIIYNKNKFKWITVFVKGDFNNNNKNKKEQKETI